MSGYGGTVKRYEIHPDPLKLQQYGINLQQLANAISNSNSNVGGDYLRQGETSMIVRGIGLLGKGKDPTQTREVLGAETRYFDQNLALANNLTKTERERLTGRFRGEFIKPSEGGALRDAWERLTARFKGEKLKPHLTAPEEQRYEELRRRASLAASPEAARFLHDEERQRIMELRNIVVTSNTNVPIQIDQLVDGGPVSNIEEAGQRGVVVKYQTRMGTVSISRRRVNDRGIERWVDTQDIVQGIVLLRKNEEALPALEDINKTIDQLNDKSGTMLPGTRLEKHWDLTHLINLTTETVRENLAVGMVLVSLILLMFLSNVRTAIIVAINIPLALLFSFSVLYLRGKSANLLSIGAVDFGIIVDSSVIIVENIYRHLTSGEDTHLPIKERIIKACAEVDKALLFTTLIMVCAFLPLFTMQGPEGQIFGPMAQTYAFALGGALVLATTLAPALCGVVFKNPKPVRDNLLVRWMKHGYLRNLRFCLKYRVLTLTVMLLLAGITGVMACYIGGEFMPELEEGNIYLRATCEPNISREEAAHRATQARAIMREFPEVELVMSQVGRPDDGTDPSGYSNIEFHVPLKPEDDWPAVKDKTGWRSWFAFISVPHDPLTGEVKAPTGWKSYLRWFWKKRPRTKPEIIKDMQARLSQIIGVDWNFSQYIRDNVTECLSGVKGDNSVKIIGPDLDELERLAEETKNALKTVRGIEDVGVFHVKGQPSLELPVDPKTTAQWGTLRGDVLTTLQTALAAKQCSSMVEGERLFDISLRFPERLRKDEDLILKIPVEVTNNQVASTNVPSLGSTGQTGASQGVSPTGTNLAGPALVGSVWGAASTP